MKMFSLLFVLICLLVGFASGCAVLMAPREGQYAYVQRPVYVGAPQKVIPIWIDKNFGQADRLAIDDAINKWNFALNGYIKLSIVDTEFDMEVPKIVKQVNSGGWLFLRINSDSYLVPNNEKGFWTIGFVEQVGGHHMYLVRDRLLNEAVMGVTMHEIGHLLGAGHVGQRLMYPHFGVARFQCVDYDTMWAVASYQGLDPDRLNYCVDKDASQVVDITKKPLDAGVEVPNCPLGSPDLH